jgi:hypothetical protein
MIEKIYLDMDGVIANFEHRWFALYGVTPADSRERKEFSPRWDKFIEDGNFATLPKFAGGDLLVDFVRSTGIPIEILSSSGGPKHHENVVAQKTAWLSMYGYDFPINIVPGSRLKRDYATPNRILIDDTDYVLKGFTDAGGIGILHKDAEVTIELLKSILELEELRDGIDAVR